MSDAGAIWLERPGYYVFEKEASEERVCLTCFGKFRTRLRLNRFVVGVPGGEGGEFSHGLSSLERTQIIKGLIVGGLGVPGRHVREEPPEKPPIGRMI